MNKHELLEQYEIRGDEDDFIAAEPLYEKALGEAPTAQLLIEYGYLLECHARRELGKAVEQYRRAIELDPAMDKAHYQLIHSLAALSDVDDQVASYKRWLAEAPREPRWYRFLSSAYLAAGRHEQARQVIESGLELAPDDRVLIAARGEAKAATGDPDGALSDWRRALELDHSDIAPLFSSAFLFEREGRLDEAIETWRSIVAWNEERGYDLAAEYPKSELERLRTKRSQRMG